ncbi:MAG: RsmE family RNA methyltransferase [Dehalococcoidia bacterium]
MAHLPRIYTPAHLASGPFTLDAEQSRRLSVVARVRAGDPLRLFNGDGREWHALVETAGARGVVVQVVEVARQAPPEAVIVEVWLSLVRPNRFDWALEKCTEAGADVVRPLIVEHGARGEGSSAARQERWRRIVVEAAEQCGRLYLPVVEGPAGFAEVVGRYRGTLLITERGGRAWSAVVPLLPSSGPVAVAVGPEGGWSAEEMRLAASKGAITATLGPNVLRSETAAVAGVALLRATLPSAVS